MFWRRTKTDQICTLAGRVSAHALLSILVLGAITSAADSRAESQYAIPVEFSPPVPLQPEPPCPAEHTFTLRHIYHHGTYRHPKLHRKHDVRDREAELWLAAEDEHEAQYIPALTAKSHALRIERLVDRRPSVVDPMVALSRERGFMSVMGAEAWTLEDIPGPDVTDKVTILSLAYMASNAYVGKPGDAEWDEVGDPFNRSADFGWENDGLRGHVWADASNSTVVIGLKGTSPAVFDGDGTTTNDKENDNLFFSCCCAQQGPWTWHQVCDCATSTYACNTTCVGQALRQENRYYQAARELYANVTELYPESNVWLTGHSLGGALSSLLGLTYGVPVVTFEAVPEALPAKRLGLPVPPGSDPNAPQTRKYTGVHHVGHTADPIYIGSCNGATASCTFGGYALESACHTGRECAYDTVGDKGWRVGIGTHKIRSVINDVLLKYDTVPECKLTTDCRDCANWKMYESNGTEATTSARSQTSTKTRTRTQTCETPGWWGCLDKSTTSATTTTSTTTTTTATTTCLTPGWFGCKDKTTTTEALTSLVTANSTSSHATATNTCQTPGRFWGCNDQSTTMITTTASNQHSITPPPTVPAPNPYPSASPTNSPGHGKCLRRNWFGFCKEWEPVLPADTNLEL